LKWEWKAIFCWNESSPILKSFAPTVNKEWFIWCIKKLVVEKWQSFEKKKRPNFIIRILNEIKMITKSWNIVKEIYVKDDKL
jgi:hypothetical protein